MRFGLDEDFFGLLIEKFPRARFHSALASGGDVIMRKFLVRRPVKVAVEIGTYWGVSAAWIAQFAEKVITIDVRPQEERFKIWGYLGIDNIESVIVKNDEEKKAFLKDLEFDFAFIDGDHGPGVMLDLELCRKCGRILFHDVDRGFSWPDKAVGTLPRHEVIFDGLFAYWEKDLQHVAFATALNDHYLPGFIALMASILKHTPGFDYDFYIFHDDTLSPHSREVCEKLYDKVRFVVPDLGLLAKYGKNHIKYFKLASFNLNFDKVICIDCDMVCLRDLRHLVRIEPPPSHIAMKREVGRPSSFNSGVVVIQRDFLNEKTYLDLVKYDASKSTYYGHDQKVLNAYFEGRIVPLDQGFNTLVTDVSNLHFIYTPWVRGHEPMPEGMLALWQFYKDEGDRRLMDTSKGIKIIACYKVFNEVEWLGVSLDSIYPYVDRIVIVEGCDSYMKKGTDRVTKEGLSADGTTELIENYPDLGGKIKHIKLGFVEDESVLWNAYMQELKVGEWCWCVDGDEVYPEHCARRMVQLVNSGKYDVIRVHLHNLWHSLNQRIVGGGWTTIHERGFRVVEPGMYYEVLSDIKLPSGVDLSSSRVHRVYENPSLYLVHLGYVRDDEKMIEKQSWQLRLYEGWDTNPKWAHYRRTFGDPGEYLKRNHVYWTGYLEEDVSVVEYILPVDVERLIKKEER